MTQSLPFLSVIIPTRNRAALLRDCIESLLAQEFPADLYEIIVVDDGSMDKTPHVVADIGSRIENPTLRYLRPEVRGLNVARNAGLKAAVGDPVVLVDDDISAPKTWLRAFALGSLRYPEAGCLGGPVRLQLEGKPPRLCQRDPLGESQLDLGDSDKAVELVCGANMAVRKAAVERVGTFAEVLSGIGDEIEWEIRLTEAGGRIVYLPEAWLWHRRTAEALRFRHLVKTRFRRGIETVRYAKFRGEHLSLWRECMLIPRFLAHAALRRCVGGLLSASAAAGRVWALVRERRVNRRQALVSSWKRLG